MQRQSTLGLPMLCLLMGSMFCTCAQAQLLPIFRSKAEQQSRLRAAQHVPLEQVSDELRDKVRLVLERPTLFSQGPTETFICQPEVYMHLLGNPDTVASGWQKLGAQCLTIRRQAPGQFTWSDDQGSSILWQTAHASGAARVWFAEGQVRPGAKMPLVPVQCVVILQHGIVKRQGQDTQVRHNADVFIHTDSKLATVVTKMMGPSAPRMAEQAIGQMQMFFAAMATYCHQHPEQAPVLVNLRIQPVAATPASFTPEK